MIRIYVDDIRPTPDGFDASFKTVNDTIKYIRRKYKEGNTNFYLDLDHDASDLYSPEGGDYINILKQLETLRYGGHLKNAHIISHFHSGNAVGIMNMRNLISGNSDWMEEK